LQKMRAQKLLAVQNALPAVADSESEKGWAEEVASQDDSDDSDALRFSQGGKLGDRLFSDGNAQKVDSIPSLREQLKAIKS
jgi:hypothetical protein